MCLLDTTDGALMMALYSSTAAAKDRITVLYYSIVLTVITVIVAIVIGVIQLLTLVLTVAKPDGKFWVSTSVVLMFIPVTLTDSGWSRYSRGPLRYHR